jgi:hypothetical protein
MCMLHSLGTKAHAKLHVEFVCGEGVVRAQDRSGLIIVPYIKVTKTGGSYPSEPGPHTVAKLSLTTITPAS